MLPMGSFPEELQGRSALRGASTNLVTDKGTQYL